jgi:hypothetical protein
MEAQDILNLEIGTKESVSLKPAKVKIVSVNIKTKAKSKDGKETEMKNPLVEVMCKHPSKDELVVFTEIKHLRNDKMCLEGLWVNKDEDGNIKKNSALAVLLNFLNAKNLADIYNKEIDTIEKSKEDSYLCLKAY